MKRISSLLGRIAITVAIVGAIFTGIALRAGVTATTKPVIPEIPTSKQILAPPKLDRITWYYGMNPPSSGSECKSATLSWCRTMGV